MPDVADLPAWYDPLHSGEPGRPQMPSLIACSEYFELPHEKRGVQRLPEYLPDAGFVSCQASITIHRPVQNEDDRQPGIDSAGRSQQSAEFKK